MRAHLFIYILGILLSLPGLVGAEELASEPTKKLWFNPYAITGVTHYQLEYGSGENVSDISDNVELSENLPFIGAGMTSIYDKFSLDFSFITSAGMLGDIDQSGGFSDPDLANIVYERDIHLKRNTWNLSFGYELYSNRSENIVVFAGYKEAKTNYGWVDHEYKGIEENQVGVAGKDNEFNTNGWFLGMNYGREFAPFGHKGRLGLNLSYAELDGEIETNRVHTDIGKGQGLRARTRNETVFSDTKGFSMGISWAGGLPVLGDNWSYSLFLERASYDFDAKSGHFTDSFFSDGYTHKILDRDLNSYDAKETIYSINFSISYFF
jgi:hypothetical protein